MSLYRRRGQRIDANPLRAQSFAFLRGDPDIDRDAVFGTKQSLVADFIQHEPGIAPDGTSVDEPFQTLR